MDKVDALELLRERNRYDVTLPSGMAVTIRLPRLRDCILAGDVPLPVLEHMAEMAKATDGEAAEPQQLSREETQHIARFQDEVALRTLVAIEGQEVRMSHDAVAELEQEDYDALVAWGTRAVAVPLADGQT